MRGAWWVLMIASVGCGAAAAPDAGPNVPAGSCGQPGDTGNELGVGRFCSPGGRECTTAPQARLCVADLSPGDGQWFCTKLCSSDMDCGMDAVCIGDSRGRACLPARCAPPPMDAGPADAGALDGGADDASPPDVGPG